MTKRFKAFRFDPELYASFKGLADACGLMVTEAFERFMASCVKIERISFPEPRSSADVEAEARILLAWLKRGEHWFPSENGTEISVQGRLLTLLSYIQDRRLKARVEDELKKKREA